MWLHGAFYQNSVNVENLMAYDINNRITKGISAPSPETFYKVFVKDYLKSLERTS
jgi:hypothetical protein